MTKCIVIGSAVHASDTARLLETSNVPARAIGTLTLDHPKILATCRNERGLEVVAVFGTDFPGGGLDLLRELRNGLDARVRVHVLKEGNGHAEPTDDLLKTIRVDEVFSLASMRPFDAVCSIKQRWFPSGAGPAHASRVTSVTATGATVTRISAEASTQAAPRKKKASPLELLALMAEKGVVTTHLASENGKPEHQSGLSLQETEEVAPQASGPPPFEKMLSIMQHNSVLPLKSKAMSIVGKHGTVLELDPRRIKPLPDNPRWATNPGFSPESLRELAEGIQLIGQAEAGEVCPIKGDPHFDAQLIDGERRLRACKIAGLMFRASVREDVTPDMLPVLWALSVVRNNGKVPQTVREQMSIVSRFRSKEFGLTVEQTATALGVGVGVVTRLSILSKLHPLVQEMLDDTDDSAGDSAPNKSKRRGGRKLTSQLALLLVPFPPKEQVARAEEIVSQRMGYGEARRHIINHRRDAGLKVSGGKKGRQAEWFQALSTLARGSAEKFGIYLDMPQKEILDMIRGRSHEERDRVAEELRSLAGCMNELARRIKPSGK